MHMYVFQCCKIKSKWLIVQSRMNSGELFVWHTHVILEFTVTLYSCDSSGNYMWLSNCVPKLAMLHDGDEFKSLTELCDKISDFEQTECVQLYIRRSRSITSAAKLSSKKNFNEDLKYSELEYVCIHGGKNFKTTSTGERPNQK